MTQNISAKKQNKPFNLYTDAIKRNKNWLIVYTIIMFLATSLPTWMLAYNVSKSIVVRPYYNYASWEYIGFFIVSFIAAIALATLFSRFMHQKNSVDLYYAMPIKRESLFMSHFLAGSTILVAPIVLNTVVVIIIEVIYKYQTQFIHYFLLQVLTTTLMALVTYALAMFVAVQLGTSFDSFTMSIVAHFAPPIVVVLLAYTISSNLFGYTMPGWVQDLALVLFPTGVLSKHYNWLDVSNSYITDLPFDHYFLFPILIWTLIGVCTVIISKAMFKKRKSEISGYTRENSVLVVLLKLVLTFGGGFLLMTLLYINFTDNILIRIIGFVIGSAIVFTILQAIAARGFKNIAKSLPQYVSVVVLGIALIVVNKTGVFGYVTRIPDPQNVKDVYTSYPYIQFGELNTFGSYIISEKRETEKTISDPLYWHLYKTENKNDIENITQIHKAIVDNRNEVYDYDNPTLLDGNMEIIYELNNGQKLARHYFNISPKLDNLRSKFFTQEYLEKYHPVYNLNEDNLVKMKVDGIGNISEKYIDIDSDDFDKIVDALQKDISDLYANGQNLAQQNVIYKIEMQASFGSIEKIERTELVDDMMFIKTSFTNTIKVLQSLDGVDQLEPKAENINKIYKLKDEYAGVIGMSELRGLRIDDAAYRIGFAVDNNGVSTDDYYAYTNDDEFVGQYFDIIDSQSEIQKYVDEIGDIFDNPGFVEYDEDKFDVVYVEKNGDVMSAYVTTPFGYYENSVMFLPKK